MKHQNSITTLLNDFSCLYNEEESCLFEQNMNSLLTQISDKERRYLFENIFQTILNNIKTLGTDLSDAQLSKIESILTKITKK
jgi:F0F1-type ATP synthase delta subunit